MTFLTAFALRRPTVTLLAIIIVLASGVLSYRSMQVELFPQIEFPLVTVFASYPSADPEAVVRDVTDPIERAISGADGLETVQSRSSEGNVAVFATFKYGTDMPAAEAFIENALNGVTFPAAVEDPTVGRFDPDAFPVIQFGVVSDRPLVEVQALVQDLIIPEIEDIEGVTQVQLVGDVDRNFIVTADLEKMSANGISLFQVSSALRDNNVTLPAGLLFDGTQAVIAKTTHSLESVEDLRDLVVGVNETGSVRLSDVADVTFGAGRTSSISRTNGKPGLSVSVSKEPEANTVDVTTAVNDVLANLDGIPDDVDVIVVTDQGPEIQGQIDNLVREGTFGFLFAVSVVFAFMLTIRPTLVRGFFNTLRPTVVIGLSIPLSVFTGILLMYWAGHDPELYDAGRSGYLRGPSRGRLHRGAGERLSPHSGGSGALAGSAGGYEGGRACDLRVNHDHSCSVCASGLHSRAGRLLLPAVRPDGFLRADCIIAGCADRGARPGRVPPAPRRPARGRR